MSLTRRQHRLLVFIARRLRATGVSPSTDDMMAALGLRSRGGVHAMVVALEQRGFLRRVLRRRLFLRRRARCIEVLRLPDDLSQRWLRGASTGAIVHELVRRGIERGGAADDAPCPLCGDCAARDRRIARPGRRKPDAADVRRPPRLRGVGRDDPADRALALSEGGQT